jgi:predicted amidohydrolase YtcJ
MTARAVPIADQKTADTILLNGYIYTMDPQLPTVEALAIRAGLIIALGDSDHISAFTGAETTVVDLQGRMAMPGLIDAHCHPTKGAIAELFSCKFAFTASLADIAQALSAFVARNPKADWIIGGRWGSGLFAHSTIASPRAWLDQYSAGKAVYLRDDSGHNGWANSEALRRLGLTRDTPDPGGGTIVRDPHSGDPTGVLLEEADVAARSKLPDWTDDQYRTGVREMVRIANRYGITGITDADATEPLLKAYRDIDQRGLLSLHVAAAISTPYGRRMTPLDYDHIEALRERYASDHVDTRFVKIYEDGVPTAARTAAMLAPYVAHHDFPSDYTGLLHVDEETLTKDIAELEKRGFTVKLHTAGDRSVRVALNAIERAHQISGRSDLRHELAHACFVDPADIPRFRALNVVADLSPYLWFPSPLYEAMVGAVGARGMHCWPIRNLLEAGAPLLAGSDWPAAVASMDPWIGIAAMVTRCDPRHLTSGSLWPEQAVNLEQALRIFTIEGAHALRRDQLTGSLQVGKSADVIVLNRNLFRLSPDAIADTVVELTLFAGRIVHQESTKQWVLPHS